MLRLALTLTAVLMVVALMSIAALANAEIGDSSVQKEISADKANLGDRIVITLTAEVTEMQGNVSVIDSLPPEFTYIPGSLDVQGGEFTTWTSDHWVRCDLLELGLYTIQFEVQVTSTPAEAAIVRNEAFVYDASGNPVHSDYAEITLVPYAGFTQTIVGAAVDSEPFGNATLIPVMTDVHWLIEIVVMNIAGDSIGVMQGIDVKDRLGGNLELDDYLTVNGTLIVDETGKAAKVHLAWADAGDLHESEWVMLALEISTAVNPGTGNNKKSGQQLY
ncbi:MAG: hypothetical protein IBX68_11870, partial [Dehalococcoidia bacterium]|nr:hypothetical protein [Dehalococcoidia bacterium]